MANMPATKSIDERGRILDMPRTSSMEAEPAARCRLPAAPGRGSLWSGRCSRHEEGPPTLRRCQKRWRCTKCPCARCLNEQHALEIAGAQQEQGRDQDREEPQGQQGSAGDEPGPEASMTDLMRSRAMKATDVTAPASRAPCNARALSVGVGVSRCAWVRGPSWCRNLPKAAPTRSGPKPWTGSGRVRAGL